MPLSASSVNRWEESDSLASGAWLVQFWHIGSIQQPNADRSESVDAALEGRMLSLSGIQERQPMPAFDGVCMRRAAPPQR
jgi:hypothetical protein